MLQSIKIPNASMAAISSKLCNLNPRNEHLNPTNKHLNPRNESFNPRNILQRPLQMQNPFVFHKGFGKITSHHFCCNFNAFPIVCPSRMPYCHVAESEAYVAEPFHKEKDDKEEDLSDKGRELQSTLRLVECAMLSAIVGLAYFLSSTLRIERMFLSLLKREGIIKERSIDVMSDDKRENVLYTGLKTIIDSELHVRIFLVPKGWVNSPIEILPLVASPSFVLMPFLQYSTIVVKSLCSLVCF